MLGEKVVHAPIDIMTPTHIAILLDEEDAAGQVGRQRHAHGSGTHDDGIVIPRAASWAHGFGGCAWTHGGRFQCSFRGDPGLGSRAAS